MTLSDFLTKLAAILAPHVGTLLGTLLGFISGWGLFGLNEWRRRRVQMRFIRRALIAELLETESLLNQLVVKFAWGTDAPGRGV